MTVERPPPRPHHLRFKYALVQRALQHAQELIELCTSQGGLLALWNEIGAEQPEAERCVDTGLGAQNVGDAERPVVMITLPPAERPNEAWFLCVFPKPATLDDKGALWVPDPTGPLELRIFGMERSMLPDGGLIGFVVEWTQVYRHNYDAPDNASPGAFWKAILEVVGGTRKPIHTMALTGAAAAPIAP
ncbi:MAG TPA: hypothetical protein VIV11_23485 [Kofleriaceae bacterium]